MPETQDWLDLQSKHKATERLNATELACPVCYLGQLAASASLVRCLGSSLRMLRTDGLVASPAAEQTANMQYWANKESKGVAS